MQIGKSIGVFCGLAVILILLYCLIIIIKNRCKPHTDEEIPQLSDPDEILMQVIPMKSNSARSKATVHEEGQDPLDNRIINVALTSQLAEEKVEPIELPVFLAYHEESRIKVLESTLVSFLKRVKIYSQRQSCINFRKIVEEKVLTVEQDREEYETYRKLIQDAVGIQKVRIYDHKDWKIDHPYEMDQIHLLNESWFPVHTLEAAHHIQQTHF